MHSYLVNRFGDLTTGVGPLGCTLGNELCCKFSYYHMYTMALEFTPCQDAGQQNALGPGAHGWNRFTSIF